MTQFRVSSKTFGWDEQEEFARLSFDYNPMHMDPLAARRTQAGRPVIHGINAALWALDQLAEIWSLAKRFGRMQDTIPQIDVRGRSNRPVVGARQ